MATNFSADEVFQMAMQMERDGARFYHKAAKVFSGRDKKTLLEELAKMEENHLRDFTELREVLLESEKNAIIDPDDISCAYLSSITKGRVFDVASDPCDMIKKGSDLKDILKKAIDLEKNSIVFYIGLKDMVSAKSGRAKVEMIISQELKHIVMLSDKIVELDME